MKKEIIRPSELRLPHPNFAPAVKAGPWVFVSGQLASDYTHGVPEEVRVDPALPLHGREDWRIREAEYIFDRIEQILAAADSDISLGIRVDQFPISREVVDPYHVARRLRVPVPRPASTSVGVRNLLWQNCSNEVELLSLVKGTLTKEGINTDKIPAPIGGYVPAIRAGDFVFIAGQMASDWKTGVPPEATVNSTFWEGNEIDLQTRYVLKNIELTLEAAGSSMANVVKAQVYLADLEDIPRLDRVWREYFPTDPPARTIEPGASFGLRGGIIEVNVVALVNDGQTKKEVIAVDDPIPRFHESAVVRAGDLVFLSGFVAADERGLIRNARVDPNFVGIGMRREVEYILETADKLLSAAGSSISQATKAQFLLADLTEAPVLQSALDACFGVHPPATTIVEVGGPVYVPGCSLIVDLWAVTS